MRPKLPETSPITSFKGPWTKLSNFSVCSVWFERHMYPSTEHAYQAAKFLDEDIQQKIRNLPTANAAKKAGRQKGIRPDWDTVKVDIMRGLLREKFSQEPEKQVLLSTGERELVEGNWWGDTFWGVCEGKGENWLGRLLMEVRNDLRNGTTWEK